MFHTETVPYQDENNLWTGIHIGRSGDEIKKTQESINDLFNKGVRVEIQGKEHEWKVTAFSPLHASLVADYLREMSLDLQDSIDLGDKCGCVLGTRHRTINRLIDIARTKFSQFDLLPPVVYNMEGTTITIKSTHQGCLDLVKALIEDVVRGST